MTSSFFRKRMALVCFGAVVWLAAQDSFAESTNQTDKHWSTPLSNSAKKSHMLSNGLVGWDWHMANGKFQSFSFDDERGGEWLPVSSESFQLTLGDGTVLKSSDFRFIGSPKIEKLKLEPDSLTLAKHFPGRQLVAKFSLPGKNLTAEWRVILRDGSEYVREQLALHASGKDVLLKNITLFDEYIPSVKTWGVVDGSPVIFCNFFFGYEQPMSQNTVDSNGFVHCSCQRDALLKDGETLTQSCVIGIAPDFQVRRGFLDYIERERPRPYQPFLHYNSWYDISWVDRKFNEAESLDAIDGVGDELAQKRGVRVDSFLFDDGWDDDRTLWQFNSGFPNGFTPLKDEAQKFHAGIGVWLSPFGGYGEPKTRRLEYAARFGYETNASGFSMAGSKYYHRFRGIYLEMIQKYSVNQFKFDGLAAGKKSAADGLTRDGDAMLRLDVDLRAAEPGIYINQTTGTWPSPFWLLDVDSTWRGGMDHSFQGKGSWCQQWMTYRDAQTYKNVVQRAPLYPLNSLMLHGIIYATNADHLNSMSDKDFADQVHSFFGSGTQLQELYITPHLLDVQNWDDLAEAAKWSRANAGTLVDTHWIGGNPGKNEIYGWASWSPRQAILVLRNPDARPVTFTADAAQLFELPSGAETTFHLHSPWKADHKLPTVTICAGQPYSFNIQPFETLVLESQ
jgi:hypothetical protein